MKFRLVRNPLGTVDIYIVNEYQGKTFVAKPVQLDFTDVTSSSERTPPTLTINILHAAGFLKSLTEELAGLDVKSDNDHKLLGVLEATKFHLEDMRKLVFTEPRTEYEIAPKFHGGFPDIEK